MMSTNSAYFINTTLAVYLMINLNILCSMLPYNWLVSIRIRLQKPKIRSPTGSKPTSSIVISSNCASLLGSIISKASNSWQW